MRFLLLFFLVICGVLKAERIEEMLFVRKVPEQLIDWIRSEIVFLDQSDLISWEDTEGRTRKTLEFGFSFKEMEENKRAVYYEIPFFLQEVRRRLVHLFEDRLIEQDPEKYVNCIVTFYRDGDGIKPHTDRRYFGRDIIGLVVTPDHSDDPDWTPSTLRFTNQREMDSFSLMEEAGTAYLFTGELRYSWTHELFPVCSERISIQFRTIDQEIVDARCKQSGESKGL